MMSRKHPGYDAEEPKKLGSMQCPTCKRFAKVIRIGNDSNPEYYYESWYAVVDCKKCGIGKNT